jgi:hypothetical protein
MDAKRAKVQMLERRCAGWEMERDREITRKDAKFERQEEGSGGFESRGLWLF